MNQYISQEETRRIIISDMVKKRDTIVPIIGDDTIVYKASNSSEEIPFQEFLLNEFQKKYPRVTVDDTALRIYPMSIEPRTELTIDMKENYHFGEI